MIGKDESSKLFLFVTNKLVVKKINKIWHMKLGFDTLAIH